MTANSLVIKSFTPQQAKVFLDEVSKNQNMVNLVRQSFSLKINVYKQVTNGELERIAQAAKEPELKQLLNSVFLVGASNSILTTNNQNGNNYQESFVIYNQRENMVEYDVLVVQASQVKELDYKKLTTSGFGAVITGIAVGLVTANPFVGLSVGAAMATASGAKAALDYEKKMTDVVSGYILQELVKQKYLQVKPNGEVIFTIE